MPPVIQSSSKGFASHIFQTMPAVKYGKSFPEKLREVVPEINVPQQRTSTTESPAAPGNGGGHAATASDSWHNLVDEADIHEAISKEPSIPDDRIRPVLRDQLLICSICTGEVRESQDIRVLPCKHTYHRSCIDHWLLHFSVNCPLW